MLSCFTFQSQILEKSWLFRILKLLFFPPDFSDYLWTKTFHFWNENWLEEDFWLWQFQSYTIGLDPIYKFTNKTIPLGAKSSAAKILVNIEKSAI